MFLCHLNIYGQSNIYTLEQCIEMAKQANPNIKANKINQEILKLNYQAAKNEYLPTVEANIRRSYNWGLFIDPATNVLSNFSSQVYSGSLYSEIEVFNGGRIYHTAEQNRLLYEASGFENKALDMQIGLEITQLYYKIYTTKQLILNNQTQLNRSRILLTKVQKQMALGIVSKKDELSIATDISAKELKLLKAIGDYNIYIKTLKAKLNIEDTTDIAFNFDNLSAENPERFLFVKYIKDSLSPQIKSLAFQLEANQHAIKVAQSAKYPILSIGGGFTTRSSNLIQTELNTQFSNNLSKIAFFNLKIPVFNKNLNNINIKRQQLYTQFIQYKMENMKYTIKNSESTERAELESMKNTYLKYQEQLALYKQQYELAEKAFELGTINFYEYQFSKNNYIDIQNQAAVLRCEILYKKVLWEKYL